MPLLQHDQGSESWLQAREGRITASLAAACLGLDPNTSRAEAWRRIRGKRWEGNHHTRWGQEFEPAARAQYEAVSGELVEQTGFWVHPLHDWLGASPDGLVGVEGLAEIKCPMKLPSCVPIHHRIQMLVQLACTDRLWCDYFAWAGNEHFTRRIHRAGIDGLIARLESFYKTWVLTGIEPLRKIRKKRSTATKE